MKRFHRAYLTGPILALGLAACGASPTEPAGAAAFYECCTPAEELFALMKTDLRKQLFGDNIVEWGLDRTGHLAVGVEDLLGVPSGLSRAITVYRAERPMRW